MTTKQRTCVLCGYNMIGTMPDVCLFCGASVVVVGEWLTDFQRAIAA